MTTRAARPRSPGVPCDSGVDHNSLNLFVDPEFLGHNPEYASQNGQAPLVSPPPSSCIEVPTVVSGQTDMTWVTTNWIAANKHASALLRASTIPGACTSTCTTSTCCTRTRPSSRRTRSPSSITCSTPCSRSAWPPPTRWRTGLRPTVTRRIGSATRQAPTPGSRGPVTVAILDQGDSAAFLFPSAALPNGANKFRTPTKANMLAALQDMTSGGQGTKLVNPNSKTRRRTR